MKNNNKTKEQYLDEIGKLNNKIAKLEKDISSQKQTEKKLQDITKRLKKTFDISPGLICVANANTGYFIKCNPAVNRILGISVKEFMSKPFMEFIHPDDRQTTTDEITKQLKGNLVANFENRYRSKDGSYKWLAWQATAADKDGKVYAVATDISKRKETEEALRQSGFRIKNLMETVPVGISISTPKGDVLEANTSLIKMFGYNSKEEFVNIPAENHYYDSKDRARFIKLMKKGVVEDFELKFKRKDGSIFWGAISSVMTSGGVGDTEFFGAIIDITERKQAEQEMLLHSETMKNMAECVSITNPAHKYIFVNKAFENVYGYKKEEIIGKTSRRIQVEGQSELQKEMRRKTKLGGWKGELINRKKDGTIFPIELSITPLRDLKGKIIAQIGISTDITNRKQAEKDLKESEDRFRSLYENSTIGLYRSTPDGHILLANPTLVKMLGYSSFNELAKRNLEKMGYAPSYERKIFIEQIEKKGEVKGIESAWVKTDGSTIYVRESARKILDTKGKTLYYDGTVEDITKRKQTEDDLKKSEEKYRKFFISDLTGDYLSTYEGKISDCNPQFLKIFGFKSLKQAKSYDILKLYKSKSERELLLKRLEKKKVLVNEESETYKVNGAKIIIQENIIGEFDDDGKLVYIRGYLFDITKRKQAEDELHKHRDHLEDLIEERNKEIEAFANSVTHDLGGPLRAISGFTKILMEDYASKLDKDGKHLGTVIQQSTEKMRQLLDGLRIFIGIGQKSMTFVNVDMKNMVRAMYYEKTTAAERKRIEFTINDMPHVAADTAMMRLVWMNLISNAVKFSSKRRKSIISVSGKAEKNKLTYCIKDNGTGFKMKYADKLFSLFERLHLEREYEGHGAGLALVHRIIQRHKGNIWAKGEIDKGAIFYFSLPTKVK